MKKLSVYSTSGVKKALVGLPKRYVAEENLALLAQAVRVYENRKHPGLSKVKTRGERAGSTRKIYRQKGTGRARHGAITAPIFVGGGAVHGPVGRKRKLTLSRKMKRRALSVALSTKVRHGEMVVVENLRLLKKTKQAQRLVDKLKKGEIKNKSNRITFALSEKNRSSKLALRNIKGVTVERFDDLNAYKTHHAGLLAVDKEALKEGSKKSSVGSKSGQNKKTKKQ